MSESLPPKVWTVAQAKARLSEILRRAEQEGPQHVGVRKSFVVVPAALWHANSAAEKPLGRWLVDNIPRGTNLDAPGRREPAREIPFHDDWIA